MLELFSFTGARVLPVGIRAHYLAVEALVVVWRLRRSHAAMERISCGTLIEFEIGQVSPEVSEQV